MVKQVFGSYAGQIDAANSQIVLTKAGPHPFKGLSVEDLSKIFQRPYQAPAIFAGAQATIVPTGTAINSRLDIPSHSLLG